MDGVAPAALAASLSAPREGAFQSMQGYTVAIRIAASGAATQDRADVVETPSGLLLLLADGAGGIGGGEQAADRVIRYAREWAESAGRLPDETDWCLWLTEIDGALESDPSAGESTAVCLSISSSGIAGASVGDSEAWLFSPEGTVLLTADQRRKPLLGSGAAVPMPFQQHRVEGDLLVASDGLFNYASDQSIREALLEPNVDDAADRLIQLVRLASGELWDDVSVIVCRST